MSLSTAVFETLKSHWAVEAVGLQDIERAEKLVNERLAQRAVGEQIAFDFSQNEGDDSFLERVALAYEIAAVEGLTN